MTHVEFLENLIKNYQQEFNKNPLEKGEEEQYAFRQGMIYAWKLAIQKLKRGETE